MFELAYELTFVILCTSIEFVVFVFFIRIAWLVVSCRNPSLHDAHIHKPAMF